MNVYISVISHGHLGIIKELGCLELLSEHFTVIIKNNNQEEWPSTIQPLGRCIILNENPYMGFGKNNNFIFNYVLKNFNPDDDDVFLVLNPDLFISPESIRELCLEMANHKSELSTINLFKDYNYCLPDQSIRNFPKFFDFLSSFIGLGNKTIIDKSIIYKPTIVDWCSGALMAFTVRHYRQLGGFDVRFFMYCEDIDICMRSFYLNEPVLYHPNIKATHIAQHANRKIISRHFYWHVSSVLKYIFIHRSI
ncbi:glycosyltransferase family 2 protein [Vibrio fluvialis]|nr:glycosyltransferase family 2 protein [Vibrio fluvialis]